MRQGGAYDSEELWKELVDARVDHINTDKLEKLHDFLIPQIQDRP